MNGRKSSRYARRMLYVGTFSFARGETETGYFTCAVEADTPEAAADALIACAKASGEREDLFDPGTRVYLDSFVGLPAELPRGVLFGFTQVRGRGVISSSMPGGEVDGVEVYEPDAEEEGEVEPSFVVPLPERAPRTSPREVARLLAQQSRAKRGRKG